jgi:hypothetical protein
MASADSKLLSWSLSSQRLKRWGKGTLRVGPLFNITPSSFGSRISTTLTLLGCLRAVAERFNTNYEHVFPKMGLTLPKVNIYVVLNIP